jgi:hypothetical protein
MTDTTTTQALMALADLVGQEIGSTWSAIGVDCIMATGGGELDSETAMECVLDANRMTTFGGASGAAADALVSEAIIAHGYGTVLTHLACHFNLGA